MVFFPGKMCSDRRKNHGCAQKKQNALALLYLASATNSSDVPTESAAVPNKDEILQGNFRSLNFSPSTKKSPEYCFELFLSIYRYSIFFLRF